MSYINNIDDFIQFAQGNFARRQHQLGQAAVRLIPKDMDIGGGRMQLHEIDALKDHPDAEILSVSGLDQQGFEYLIQNYGRQFKILQFFKNKRVEDWSALGQLPDLEYVYYFFNQRIERFWDMRNNKKLRGISILDFSRLKTLSGIETAENLEYFCLGNAVWDKSEVDSFRYFADTNVRFLCFAGKKILDREPAYLARIPRLEQIYGVLRGCSREQFAWVKANAANDLNIGPMIGQGQDLKTLELYQEVRFPWKGQRSYKLEGNEAKYSRDLAQFQALVDQYRGVPYEMLFPPQEG